jgi:alkanesulfonate monooxygenase SsuD/methylene tetrahydromethanopterin reductase-like flavin-dependent oxidoreductase (luciferase family)
MAYEIGLYSLGDHFPDPLTSHQPSTTQRLNQLVDMAVLAEELGFDCFGVGESHQAFFTTQAHSVVLAAMAAKTKTITLFSSSSVLSTVDPVRLFEDFATLDHLSSGRIEVVLGRASRLGAFELFGVDPEDYDRIYDEKLELFLKLNQSSIVTWNGKFRPPLNNQEILPRPFRSKLVVHRAVGGPPASAIEAGRLGMNMMLATLGGPISSFKTSVDLYRHHAQLNGHEPQHLKVTIAGLCHVASTNQEAIDRMHPYLDQGFRALRKASYPKEWLKGALDPHQALMIGDPTTLVEKLKAQIDTYNHHRTILQIDFGGMPTETIYEVMMILANDVIPQVKAYAAIKGL